MSTPEDSRPADEIIAELLDLAAEHDAALSKLVETDRKFCDRGRELCGVLFRSGRSTFYFEPNILNDQVIASVRYQLAGVVQKPLRQELQTWLRKMNLPGADVRPRKAG